MSPRARDEPVRLTRIYTRGGDQGETSLGDGSRVSKLDCRIGAFGTVDELFAGETADLAKVHALRVASAFHARLQSFPSPADPVPLPGAAGIVVTRHDPRG